MESVAWGFPGGSDGRELACNAGDPGSISEPGRSPGERNSNPLQHSRWIIPQTEKPDRLSPWGHTVRQD